MDTLNFKWRKTKCNISILSQTGVNLYDYIDKEYEYIDLIVNKNLLGDILQVNGNFISWFNLESYEKYEISEIIPFISKTKEQIFYYKPDGANIYDNQFILCDISVDNEIITWDKFSELNGLYPETIDYLRKFHFDKSQYIETFQRIFEELIKVHNPTIID